MCQQITILPSCVFWEAQKQWHLKCLEHTKWPDLVSKYDFLIKGMRVLRKWLIVSLKHEKCKVSLEYLLVPESKFQVFRKKKKIPLQVQNFRARESKMGHYVHRSRKLLMNSQNNRMQKMTRHNKHISLNNEHYIRQNQKMILKKSAFSSSYYYYFKLDVCYFFRICNMICDYNFTQNLQKSLIKCLTIYFRKTYTRMNR